MSTTPDQRYFFERGLHFECTRCGACCTGGPGVVRVTDAEIEALARHVGLDEETFRAKYTRMTDMGLSLTEVPSENWRCVFFDRGCTVYPVRPLQCRTFPFWVRNLRSREAWDQVARECPGVNNGPVWTRSEILDRLAISPV